MHIRCPTDHAVMLVTVKDSAGIWRVLVTDESPPGLPFAVVALAPINDQLREKLGGVIANADSCVSIRQDIAIPFQHGGHDWTLYMGAWEQKDRPLPEQEAASKNAQFRLVSFPDLLRAMSTGRERLAYLKAWQVVAGAMGENVKAVFAEDMLKALQQKITKETT